uniref:Polygalacturonase n=1 Tax=Kalanchoe fedtschenkoi TaxID=63787 RepID=A0A7N0TVW3_KALFE
MVSPSSGTTYDVVSYGANPGSTVDSTAAFLTAWNLACASSDPSTLYVPTGTFLLKSLKFRGPCLNSALTVQIDGTLVAPSDYNVIGTNNNWIIFQHVDGVTVNGGILDGQGSGLWACKASGNSCPVGVTSMEFSNSSNVVVNGLTSLNSQMFHIVIYGSQNVKLQDVKVNAAASSPNTDGIHIQASTDVTVFGAKIQTGDDCVSIGPGSSNLWIENVECGPGHGISIGSLGREAEEVGVQNVTVKTATFLASQNGVRIKSWGRPSSSFVNNVLFQHITMNNVQNPIIIDQDYCPGEQDCPGKASGVKISDVTYQDIHGTSAKEVAVKIDCSPENPCSDIKLQDVELTFQNRAAEASCSHVDGSVSGIVQPSGCLKS